MPPQTPQGTTEITIPNFGTVTGLVYPSGTRQFCGIPYAHLKKRWTRSTLNTALPEGKHDGTQYGPVCPEPPQFKGDDPTLPVPRFPHFKEPVEDEFKCLNLNIILPKVESTKPLPVMLWIHGGSFLFGSSSVPAYDMVNLVTHSAEIGKPVVGVGINYRVGLFGFLASQAIKDDLSKDGFAGVGNYGLTDQQTAIRWVHQHIASVGGDPNNVTIFGESAGGMSVAHQVWAADPAPFRRAISMSGLLNTIPPWSLSQHERRYKALSSHLKTESESGERQLEQLRAISQEDIARATCAIEGSMYATGNPCDDGWYHSQSPSVNTITSPPSWLDSYMTGDVRDEAMIFRGALDKEDYNSIYSHFSKFMDKDIVSTIFGLYNITPDLTHEQLAWNFEQMASDGVFKLHTYRHIHASEVERTFGYHFDQYSTLDNPLKGLAYHVIDILYLLMNMQDKMTDGQKELGRAMASHFITYAYGEEPWERVKDKKWMVYGPDDKWGVKTEDEDEKARGYKRMKQVLDLGVFAQWLEALDYVVNKRWLLGAAKTE